MAGDYLATGGMGVSTRYAPPTVNPEFLQRGTPQYRQAIRDLRDWQWKQIAQGASLDQLGIRNEKEHGKAFYNEVQNAGPQAYGRRGDWVQANQGFRYAGGNPFYGYKPRYSPQGTGFGGFGGADPNAMLIRRGAEMGAGTNPTTAPDPNAMLIRRGAGMAPGAGGFGGPAPTDSYMINPRKRRGATLGDILRG